MPDIFKYLRTVATAMELTFTYRKDRSYVPISFMQLYLFKRLVFR